MCDYVINICLQTQVWKFFVEPIEGIWLTVDSWTSRANQTYAAVIAHYLTNEFEPRSFLLSTIATNEHDAEAVSEEIIDLLKTWEMCSTVMGMVGDNTRVVPKTAKLISEHDEFKDFEFWGCIAHLLNLVVSHALEEVCNIAFL